MWWRPLIPFLFLGVPFGAACGLQLAFAGTFSVFQTHPGAVRLGLAVIMMPFWWLLLMGPERAARRLAVLTWSHLVFQWLGLAGALPLAGWIARPFDPTPSEKMLCLLFLALLPFSVYLMSTLWLCSARFVATRDELMGVTQVWTRFDCWLFDKIVGKDQAH
jgi:hypothetical protein